MRYFIGYLVGFTSGMMTMRSIHTHREIKFWRKIESDLK